MTKLHYQAIARLLRDHRASQWLVQDLAEYFKAFDPEFTLEEFDKFMNETEHQTGGTDVNQAE